MKKVQNINWRFISKIDIKENNECWEFKGCKNKYGYGCFNVNNKALKAHRFAYQLVNGLIPAGLCVCHKCDNPICVNPNHLFLGTHQNNMEDMKIKGRAAKGLVHNKAKLSVNQVYQIRAAVGTVTSIAKQFGISTGQVSGIRHRKYWKHLP